LAETIKGINVVIGAETTGLSAALSDVNKKSRDIQSELKQVEKLLKLDPSNTELVAQKQKLLGDAVANTREKLDRLRAAQEQVNDQLARGEISQGQYRAFQREVAKTEAELRNLEDRLSDVTKELGDQSGFVKKLGKDYQESFEQAKQSLGNTFEQAKKLGTGMTAAGAAIAAGLGVAVKGAADFEQGMANVYSVMAPDEVAQFKDELKDLAVTMGAQTKYSATEAARGIEELVKAGVSVQDILNGGLSGALSLATAGELELADAAEIASTALNAFKDDAITVQQAADILAGAANASATSVGELKFGLSQVSAVASGVGLSFEDTVTALAAFAQNGLKGSDAGTSLKTMLMNLQPSTEAAYNEFKRLGLLTVDTQKVMEYFAKVGIKPASESVDDITSALAGYIAKMDGAKTVSSKYFKQAQEMIEANGWVYSSFYDANGQLKSMSEIADLLNKSMANLNDRQRQAALEVMFGSDAIRAANILYKEGAQGVEAMATAMGKISAEDVAAQKLDTFKGTLEQLSGSLETAQIAIGSALIPALRTLTGIIQKVVDGFNSLPSGVQSTIATVGALTTALLLFTGPLLLLIGYIPQIVAGFTLIRKAMKDLTTVQWGLNAAMNANPIGLIIAALVALAAAVYLVIKNWESIKQFFVDLWGGIASVTISTWDSIKSGLSAAWESIKSTTISVFESIATFFTNIWNGIVSFVTNTWNGLIAAAQSAFTALVGVVRPIMDGFKTFFAGVWEAIKNIFAGALLLIVDLVTGDFENLSKDAQAIWNNLKNAFANIWDGIKQVFTASLDLIAKVLDSAWSGIKTTANSAWSGIKSIISSIVSATVSWIKDAWNALLGWFRSLPDLLYKIGSNMFGRMRDAVVSTVTGVKDAIVTGITAAIDWIKTLPAQMVQLGKDIIQGLVNGIKGMTDKVGDAIKGVADKVTSGIRDALGIHSPSRVTMQLGEYTGEGFAQGIAKSGKKVRKSAEELAKEAFEASKAWIDERKYYNQLSLEEELTLWQKIASRYKEGTEQRKAADREVYRVKQEILKAQEQAERDSFEKSKQWIESRKQFAELSLMEELSAWERVQQRYAKGSQERIEAEKQAAQVRQEIYNQLKAASDDYLAKVKEINDNLAAEEQRLTEAYQKAVEDRASQIYSFASIFDEVTRKADVTGEKLIENLNSQVEALKEWSSALASLAARGIDQGLLAELQSAGPKAADEIMALNYLTDAQLEQYQELWREKSRLAREQAVSELQGLKNDTDQQIAELRQKASNQLTLLSNEFQQKISSIRTGTTGQFNAMVASMPEIGKQVINGLISGLASMQGQLVKKAQEIANSVSGTIRNALKIHSPSRVLMELGEYTGEGFIKGIGNTIADVRQRAADMAAAASGVLTGVTSPTVQMAGASGSGANSFSAEGIFAGAVLNFSVRNDNDISLIAKEIYNMQQTAMRRVGIK